MSAFDTGFRGMTTTALRKENSAGYADLVCRYQAAITEGTLTGELLDGTPIEGVDTFCVVH